MLFLNKLSCPDSQFTHWTTAQCLARSTTKTSAILLSEKRVPKASLLVQIFEFNQLETLLLLQGTRKRLESAQFSHDTNSLRLLQE